ncbi:nuclear transport factor 2 family protein [Robiginitalea sp. SC105]|uniref:nuclear transport factor 2 family protein n=1 Tax=Robiginitalea sp. SC105 TaxID=2762332 RepID=UPI00163990CB|nr:nuclear transport factor 2 family protein [Robiginitalea sp. SC105]MBC2840719.1 nuclear transport factor 2 family protein [Robiginitalea sp. SC105]
MKRLLCFGFLIFQVALPAQQDREGEIRSSIDRFFEGFHARDTNRIKTVLFDTVLLQTIGRGPDGKAALRTEPMGNFLKSIAGIPDSVAIEERLLDYKIRIDGNMAHAWTPYEFYLRGEFSHCGVNSFQLFRGESGWKIIYIVDTRRREGCN